VLGGRKMIMSIITGWGEMIDVMIDFIRVGIGICFGGVLAIFFFLVAWWVLSWVNKLLEWVEGNKHG
jgi:hypothetical protein